MTTTTPGPDSRRAAAEAVSRLTSAQARFLWEWNATTTLNLTGTMLALKHGAASLVRGGGGAFVAISSTSRSCSDPCLPARLIAPFGDPPRRSEAAISSAASAN